MSDSLSVIIIILIIAIVLDGLRRARLSRRGKVKLSPNARKADAYFSADEDKSSASIISPARRKALAEQALLDANAEHGHVEDHSPRQKISSEPFQSQLELDEPVPMLMDSVVPQEDLVSQEDHVSQEDNEPSFGELNDLDRIVEADGDTLELDFGVEASPRHKPEKSAPKKNEPKQPAKKETSSLFSAFIKTDTVEPEPDYQGPKEILIINVMAPAGMAFNGDALLEALTDAQLKFGERGIFHRHLDDDADGAVLYSAANMVEPGNFDLCTINDCRTPGICLFLSLPCACEGAKAYDDLVSTARHLANALGGELKDENRSTLTNQNIEHGRQRVMEFERKQKLYQ